MNPRASDSQEHGPEKSSSPKCCPRAKRVVAQSHDAFYLPQRPVVNAGTDLLARAFLEVTLRRRNITIGELADRCGWNRRAFLNEFGTYFPCQPLRFQVERALEFLPIWSSGAETDLRQRCWEDYGIDPRTASLVEVQQLCRRLGVESPQVRRLDAWVSNLLAWLVVNRSRPKSAKEDSA